MVVTPIIAGGIPLELPRTLNHDRKPDDGKDIIISVTRDKRVFIAGKPVNGSKEIVSSIEQERRQHLEKTAFIKGDARPVTPPCARSWKR